MAPNRRKKHTHSRPPRRASRYERRVARTDSLPALYSNLRDAEWGVFRPLAMRGACWVLEVLCHRLDPDTGAGQLCVDDICASVRYRERTVRRHLRTLEDLGLIEWRRSGGGPAQPSSFRVHKSVLHRIVGEAKADPGKWSRRAGE